MKDQISDQILKRVRKAKFFQFYVMKPLTRQLKSRYLYVDVDDWSLKEDFTRFTHCELGLSGQALSKIILKTLKSNTRS